MLPQDNDTHPEIHQMLIEGYRRMTPAEKMQRVNELTKGVQQMALARLIKQYPDATEKEHRLRLGALWLDRETMIKVFDWDPEKEGY